MRARVPHRRTVLPPGPPGARRVNPRITGADDPMPRPPEAPLPSDCCDSGCDPCVYDLYNEALQQYRERLAQWRQRHPDATSG
jgi:hypothetical protein